MSDVKEARARLRPRLQSGKTFVFSNQFEYDMAILAAADLAEHPADEDSLAWWVAFWFLNTQLRSTAMVTFQWKKGKEIKEYIGFCEFDRILATRMILIVVLSDIDPDRRDLWLVDSAHEKTGLEQLSQMYLDFNKNHGPMLRFCNGYVAVEGKHE